MSTGNDDGATRHGIRYGWAAGLVAALLVLVSACTSYPLRDQPSGNQDGRVRFLILHYTSEDLGTSLRLLTQPTSNPVSAHYLVDTSAGAHGRPRVYRLVPESARAWHAGRSYWSGESALNASSIGIEIVNTSRCTPQATLEGCAFEPYPRAQVRTIIELCQEILARHPDIVPWRVLGHADVAPTRKVDPGPLFPWKRLHEAGIGAWYEEATVERYRRRFAQKPLHVRELQAAMGAWGFDLAPTGEVDTATRDALRAFQLHFRPERYDGLADEETGAILFALIERYRPQQLERLLGR